MKTITVGSVCTGIGAPEVAWKIFGWQPVWMAEIEPSPSSVLAHHWPHVPNMGDMTQLPDYVRMRLVAAPDILVGGTPCQAYSIAGLRAGLDDPRGQLTLKFVELANAIDEQRTPGDECIVVWENVPGVLSDKTNAFGHLLAGLAGEDDPLVAPGGKWPNAGVVYGPQRNIAWRVLDAQFFGVAQRRRRVFVVASARNGFDPAAVLFELDGVRRNSPPSRSPGQGFTHDIAPCLTSSGRGVERNGDTRGQDPVVAVDLRNGSVTGEVAHTLQANGHGPSPGDTPHLLTFSAHAQPDEMRFDEHVTSALTWSQQQAVCFAENSRGELRLEGGDGQRTGALSTGGGKPGQGLPVVCITGDVTHTLKAEGFDGSEDGTGRGQPIVAYRQVDLLPLWQVRRLTPRECERLQGFPDDHTLVPHPLDRRKNGSTTDRRGVARVMADGPRYKMLGNSMCVDVMRWLGARLIVGCPEAFI